MGWSIEDESHRPIIEELESQTDRGAAIIGAALLEERLEEAIRGCLLDNDGTDSLFKPFQAASTFSAKIRLAYSLGLCGEQMYRDLNLIRQIRNDFAHFVTPLNFNCKRSVGNDIVSKMRSRKQGRSR
jgi:DNA-binding MltR family transcriptional regulator